MGHSWFHSLHGLDMGISYLPNHTQDDPRDVVPRPAIDLDAFRAVFDASPQGVMVHRLHRPLYVNDAWAAIHGLEAGEIMALETIAGLISPGDRERMVIYNNDRLAGRQAPTRYHYQLVQTCGRLLWVEIFVQQLEWFGEPAVQCTVIDARPREDATAERLLRAEDTTAKFQSALEESSEGFALFDQDHRLVVWNRRFEEMHPEFNGVVQPGMAFEDIARIRLGKGLIADAVGREEEWLEERLRQFGRCERSRDLKTSGGRWYQSRERPLANGCILFSSIDITERREAELALAEERALLRAIIDNIPEAIFAKDREARFIVKNRFDAGLMGAKTVDEIAGRSDFDYYPEDLARAFYEEDMQVINEGLTITGEEQEFACGRDGRPAWLSTTKAPLRNTEGEIIGLVGCTHDVTERKLAELDLARHRDQLEETVAERTAALQEQAERLTKALEKERELSGLQRQFVSMVSHEFRTPLAIIDGNARRAIRDADKTSPDRLQAWMDKIRVSVGRLTDLMETVLSTARLDAGSIKFQPKPCRPADMIIEVCANYRDLNPNYGINEDLEGLPETFSMDVKLMRQVVSNLISNAIKYSPDGDNIWVSGRTNEDGAITISVRDEGIGIPEEELNRLFARFFRASTSEGIAGTGIGLNMVKGLVDMHDGHVDVVSEMGKGTTFAIHLPWCDVDIAATKMSA